MPLLCFWREQNAASIQGRKCVGGVSAGGRDAAGGPPHCIPACSHDMTANLSSRAKTLTSLMARQARQASSSQIRSLHVSLWGHTIFKP